MKKEDLQRQLINTLIIDQKNQLFNWLPQRDLCCYVKLWRAFTVIENIESEIYYWPKKKKIVYSHVAREASKLYYRLLQILWWLKI